MGIHLQLRRLFYKSFHTIMDWRMLDPRFWRRDTKKGNNTATSFHSLSFQHYLIIDLANLVKSHVGRDLHKCSLQHSKDGPWFLAAAAAADKEFSFQSLKKFGTIIYQMFSPSAAPQHFVGWCVFMVAQEPESPRLINQVAWLWHTFWSTWNDVTMQITWLMQIWNGQRYPIDLLSGGGVLKSMEAKFPINNILGKESNSLIPLKNLWNNLSFLPKVSDETTQSRI